MTTKTRKSVAPNTLLAIARVAIDRWESALKDFRDLDGSETYGVDSDAYEKQAKAFYEAIEAIRDAVASKNGPIESGIYKVPHEFAGIPHNGHLYMVVPCERVFGLDGGAFSGIVTIMVAPLVSVVKW